MLMKQTIAYLVLSLLAVMGASYLQQAAHYVATIYSALDATLVPYLSNNNIRHILLMIVIPIFFASIPAILYRLIKKQDMPYYLPLTWILWMILIFSRTLAAS